MLSQRNYLVLTINCERFAFFYFVMACCGFICDFRGGFKAGLVDMLGFW
jgi:hypothetical protein